MVRIDYTNFRGERRSRLILPHYTVFQETKYHEGPQWFCIATCLEARALRGFAMNDVHSWKSEPTQLPWRA